ncbi:hypothetical protein FB451DRAFT_1507194 [Mycena latifolia]|nr:hypothetical protein FB451DRAFT_1507194 [Mycena latifolia]
MADDARGAAAHRADRAPPRDLRGPEFVARAVLCGSPALVSLAVNAAVDLIERANTLTLRDLELSLMKRDDEVLLTFAHRLAAARSLKVSFHFSQPPKEFIFNLGLDSLPLLAQLHLLAEPEARAERVLQGRRGHVSRADARAEGCTRRGCGAGGGRVWTGAEAWRAWGE